MSYHIIKQIKADVSHSPAVEKQKVSDNHCCENGLMTRTDNILYKRQALTRQLHTVPIAFPQ